MGITMKKALALVMALLLALPGFVFAEDDAATVELDGELLVSNDGLELADGLDLVLDGLSLDLTGDEGPLGDIELDITEPEGQEVEIEGGGEGEEAGKPEASEAEGPEVEVEGDVEGVGDNVPEAEPLLPPDWAVEGALEGETDAAMMANVDEHNTYWNEVKTKVADGENVALNTDCVAGYGDVSLLKATNGARTLDLNGHYIDRARTKAEANGGVIALAAPTDEPLTIEVSPVGGHIQGGKTTGNGGGIRLSQKDDAGQEIGSGPGYLILKNGGVGYNTAANGGGAYLSTGSRFDMERGLIAENTATDNGGGVYLSKGSQFSMNATTIEYNTATNHGGGVYVSNGSTFNISGSSFIINNTVDKKANNVYLKDGAVINVIGALDSVARIGVTMEKPVNDKGIPIPFTKDLSVNGGITDPAGVFMSDDDENYAVYKYETGQSSWEAALIPKIKDETKNVDEAEYDGKIHTVTVKAKDKPKNTDLADPTIRYGKSAGAYTESDPTKLGIKDVGSETTIYYKITKDYYLPATGSATVKIVPKTVTLDWSGSDKYTYSGQKQGPGAKVSNIVGTEDVGVTVKYKAKGEGDDKLSAEKPVVPGDYVAVAVGLTGDNKGNYKLPDDNLTMAFTITARPISDGSGIAMTLSPTSYVYDGKAKMPAVTVKDGDTTLTEDVDYTVQQPKGRTDVGDYTVKVTGKGNYSGERSAQFSIEAAKMTVSAKGYSGTYDEAAHGITVNVTEPSSGSTVKYGESEGACDKDSSPTYTDAGTHTVYYKVTASNYVTATGSAKVEIAPKVLDDENNNVVIELNPASYTYDGEAKEPEVMVKDLETGVVVPESEYTVRYSDNVDAGTAKATVADVSGGNYTVSGSKTFAIAAAKMTVSAEGYSGTYDGAAHGITVKVTEPTSGYAVKYGEAKGTYDKDGSPAYTEAGTYTVYYQVTAKNYEAVTGSAKVEIKAKAPDGDGSEDDPGDDPEKDPEEQKIAIVIELSKTAYTYNGEAKKPKVTVKRKDNGEEVPDSEYTVTYSKNVNAGKAKVTVADVAGGKYKVSGSAYFTIAPKTVGLYWSNTEFTYDTQPHAPTATATGLVEGDTCEVKVEGAQIDSGRYIASATGLSNANYALPENVEHEFAIYARVLSQNLGNVKIDLSTEMLPYSGLPLTPGITLKTLRIVTNAAPKQSQEMIVPKDEYKVTYYNNVNPGTATVRITNVKGGNYIIDVSTTFTITRRKVTVTAADQSVKVGGSIKTGVGKAKLAGQVKGHVLKSVKLSASSTAKATTKGKITPSGAKIVDAKGNDVTKNYKITYVAGKLTVSGKDKPEPEPEPEPEPKPLPKKPDYTLLAEMKTCGQKALRISWTPVAKAEGYEVTFARSDGSLKKGKRVSVVGSRTVKLANLKKKTVYRAYVRAWKMDGKKRTYIGKASPVVCAITDDANKKWTNAESVTVKTAKVTLAVGKQATVRATVKGVNTSKHTMRLDGVQLRWYSSNANVATVNKGVITAVAKGECTVYAFAANGKRAAVKVKVKKN